MADNFNEPNKYEIEEILKGSIPADHTHMNWCISVIKELMSGPDSVDFAKIKANKKTITGVKRFKE